MLWIQQVKYQFMIHVGYTMKFNPAQAVQIWMLLILLIFTTVYFNF